MEPFTSTPSTPGAMGRTDLVMHKGRLALSNSRLTPIEAMVDDLLFLRRVLLAAKIDFFLVHGNDERPVIVIDRRNKERLESALATAVVQEPFYSKTVDGKAAGRPNATVLVADGKLSIDSKAKVFRLYRPRVEPTGGLAYGSRFAVQLELWKFGGKKVRTPIENALTRRVIPRSEFVESTVDRFGETWRSFAPMFSRLSSDIDFDIDLVYSWVDGTDVEFQRARARRMQSYIVGEGDDHAARYRQLDELKYALRSVHLFAPWIRRIFIATDSPVPAWLGDHPKVTVVRSEEFFADPTVLPTHNSQAVESQLHHIEGLAEHFLYSNDDMFFARPVTPDMFFTPGGVTRFIQAGTRIGLGSNNDRRSGFENAARVNRRLLESRFGVTITRHLEHTPVPLRKTVMQELEHEFAEEFTRTAASTFRAKTNISVTNSLYHYYALHTGRAVPNTDARVRYVDTTTRVGITLMNSLLDKRSLDMFCLNDGSFPEVSGGERADAVRSFLDRYFAIPAPWETSRANEGEQAV